MKSAIVNVNILFPLHIQFTLLTGFRAVGQGEWGGKGGETTEIRVTDW